jgi:hypothetical protein
VRRYDVLEELHRAYRPRTYLEIGVNRGRSLSLSRTKTIAVDPAFKIKAELACDLELVKATSDEFFARAEAFSHFDGDPVDLAFIDGLHAFEFVLRDFVNVERHADWTSVIVVDDIFPRSSTEAARERKTRAWAGDVFKIVDVLAEHRPDLLLVPLDTEPTGVLIILGADPESEALGDGYADLVGRYVHDDPQVVPPAVLRREGAFDAATLLQSSLWSELARARDAGRSRADGWPALRKAAEQSLRRVGPRSLIRARAVEPARLRAESSGSVAALRRALRVARVRQRRRPGALG